MTDRELLDAYLQKKSEDALRALIERYVRLVYGACRRQLREDALAQDATQGVFILLSRKAGSIREERIAGWLLTAARYACATIRRDRARRARREEAVAVMEQQEPVLSSAEMEELRLHLDEGLLKLGAIEREALVRRYLQGQSLGEVGAALHLSEEAARKRVVRGLEELRYFFSRAGISCSGGAAIVSLLEGEALRTGVREVFAQTVLEGCRLGHVATAGHGIAKGVSTMMLIAKGKVAATAALIVGAVSLVGYEGWSLAQTNAPARAASSRETIATPVADPTTRSAPLAARVPQIQQAPADKTTPRGAVECLARAIRSGDIKAVEACVIDPIERTESLPAALVAWHTAEWRAKVAADKATPNIRHATTTSLTLDLLMESLLGVPSNEATGVKIDGDTATIKSGFSNGNVTQVRVSVSGSVPAGVLEVLGAWRNGTIYVKKIGDEWRVDLDKTLQVETGLQIAGATPTKDELHTQIVLLEDLKRGLENAAREIDKGTPEREAYQTMMEGFQQLPQKYPGFQDSYSIKALPKDGAKVSPTP